MINILSKENSLCSQFIAELRDITIQQDRMRFRRNMERLGEIFAYEISKKMVFKNREVTTPLGIAQVAVIENQPVVASILRAGLPLHNGITNYFDKADNSFVSAYRIHHKDGGFDIKIEYLSSPTLTNRILILCDPMLATGTSMVLAYKALLEKGKPAHTHIVSTLASKDGINYIKSHLSAHDITLWVGAVDEELTAQSFIVPGLGDAGDLSFGGKN